MTDKSIQAFLAARGKAGEVLVDYLAVGDEHDGTVVSFVVWNAAKLGPAPTAADIAAMHRTEAHVIVAAWDIVERAKWATLIDQLNVIRNLLPVPLGPISPAQAINALNAKIDSLT